MPPGCRTVIAGIGVGIVYGVPLAVAAKWFPHNKGIVVGTTVGHIRDVFGSYTNFFYVTMRGSCPFFVSMI